MSSTLSPSGLKVTSSYGESGWALLYNDNFVRLNSTLLKLQGLLDATNSGLSSGKVMVYLTATGKWTPYSVSNRRPLIL